MSESYELRNETIRYSLLTALIIKAVYVIIAGFNMQFTYGLILGTAVAIVNFNISYFVIKRIVLYKKGAILNFLSYILRISIYGYVFFKAIQISQLSALGIVAGFLTIKISIYYINVIKKRTINNKGI